MVRLSFFALIVSYAVITRIVDLSTIYQDDELLPFIKGESLLEMLNVNDGQRKKALREVIRRRLDKIIVTVRSQNNYYLEKVKLKDML